MPPAPRSLWLYSAAIAAAVSVSWSAAAQQVGVSSAVNPAAQSLKPGQTQKQLLVGENIVFNEHITTGADGQTQILFVDESAMSIGPNSDMTIDEFVYDPKTGTGTEALSATRGVFRYVGGKLSKATTPVTIKTPVATIGIRGGVFLLDLDGKGNLEVIFLYGKGLTITGLTGLVERITRPGFGVTIANGTMSSPSQAPKGRLASFIAALDGKAGSNGGSTNVPTDATVANSGISDTVSNNVVGSIQQSIQSQGGLQTQTFNNNLQTTLNLNTTESQGQPALNNSSTDNSSQNTGEPNNNQNNPPPPILPPNRTNLSGGTTGVNTASDSSGFTGQLIPYSNASIQDGVFTANIGTNQITFNVVQGTGAIAGTGPIPTGPFTATAVITQDGTFFYADAALVSDPSKVGVIYGGTPVSQSAYAAPSTPQFLAFTLQKDGALQSPVPFITNQLGGNLANPDVSPMFLAVSPNTGFGTASNSGSAFPKALQASLAINGTGPGQSSMLMVAAGNAFTTTGNPGQTTASPVLNGIAEGSYLANGTSPSTRINTAYLTGVDGVGNSFYGGNSIEGFALTPNNCCNSDGSQTPGLASATNTQTGATASYGFVQPALATTPPAIASGPQTQQTLIGFMGGTMTAYQNGTGTPYAVVGATTIATDPANLQMLATMAGTDPFAQNNGTTVGLSYGSLTPGGTNARQGYINDNLFGSLESPGGAGSSVNGNNATSANLYMVNANAVPNNPLLPNGLCQCQYLQWGYWGGELDTNDSGGARADVAHINSWVAGVPTSPTDIGNLITMGATASYAGNAFGAVNSNGANYLASGAFTQSYNFGTRTGTVAVNNFDGRNFSGSVTGTRSGPAFAGTLSGTNLSGNTLGSFFGPNAAETGGTFAVKSTTGLPYVAAGVFAGKKN